MSETLDCVQRFINTYGGLTSFRCFIHLRNPENDRINQWVECMIDESRYVIAHGYKVQLVDVHDTQHTFTIAQADFMSLVDNDILIAKQSPTHHIGTVQCAEPINATVMIIHEFETLLE